MLPAGVGRLGAPPDWAGGAMAEPELPRDAMVVKDLLQSMVRGKAGVPVPQEAMQLGCRRLGRR